MPWSPAELIVSIFNEMLFTLEITRKPNVNIHPAPPAYPGRGSATMALYDGAETFGPTAHRMIARADAGEIVGHRPFPITARDNCETIFARAERACVDLLADILDHWAEHGRLPEPDGATWARAAMTTTQFREWLILPDDATDDEIERRVRAAKHSRYPGPYIRRNGRLFALSRTAPPAG